MQGPSLQHLGEAEAPGFIPGGSFFDGKSSTTAPWHNTGFHFGVGIG
jgi:hypothetical protein